MTTVRNIWSLRVIISAILSCCLFDVPAAAQLGGSLTVLTQERLRGRAVSDHQPVAEAELVYDMSGDVYLGGSASLVATRDDGIRPLAFRQYAGWARRLRSGPVLDIGVIHGGFTEYSGLGKGGSYTEAYAGLIGRRVSTRLSFSPAYFRKNQPTLYWEADGSMDLTPRWSLFAHGGLLAYLHDQADQGPLTADWRIGARRHLGRMDVDVAWTGYVTGGKDYSSGDRQGGALVAGASFAF